MFYDIILGTSQTVTSKAVSRAHSKNNTPLIENNSSALKTKVTMENEGISRSLTLLLIYAEGGRPIKPNTETVDKILKATVCLHNYLRLTDNAHYVPQGFVDCESSFGEIIPGDWRSFSANDDAALQPLNRIGTNTYPYSAKDTRRRFEAYFNSEQGSIP